MNSTRRSILSGLSTAALVAGTANARMLFDPSGTGALRPLSPCKGGVFIPQLPTPVLIDGFESLSGLTATGAALSLVASPRVQGSFAAKRTYNASAAASITGTGRALGVPGSELGTIAFWESFDAPYWQPATVAPTITVGGLAYAATQTFFTTQSAIPGRWFAYHADDFLNAGNRLGDLGTIASANFKFAEGVSSPSFTDMENDCLMYKARGQPTLNITFDDGPAGQYTNLFPLLTQYGLKASFAPVKSQAGAGGRMTVAQMQEMYAAGHDFVVDATRDDSDITQRASLATAVSELNEVRSWLQGLGMPRGADHIVWPFGAFERSIRINTATLSLTAGSNVVTVDSTAAASIQVGHAVQAHPSTGIAGLTVTAVSGTSITLSGNAAITSTTYRARFGFTDDTNAPFYGAKLLDAAKAAGFKTGRTVSAPGAAYGFGNHLYSRYGMSGQEMAYPAISVTATTVASDVLAAIDRTIKLGTTLATYAHDVQATGSGNTVPIATWDAIFAGVAQRVAAGTLVVLTVSQWHARDLANPAPLPF